MAARSQALRLEKEEARRDRVFNRVRVRLHVCARPVVCGAVWLWGRCRSEKRFVLCAQVKTQPRVDDIFDELNDILPHNSFNSLVSVIRASRTATSRFLAQAVVTLTLFSGCYCCLCLGRR